MKFRTINSTDWTRIELLTVKDPANVNTVVNEQSTRRLLRLSGIRNAEKTANDGDE